MRQPAAVLALLVGWFVFVPAPAAANECASRAVANRSDWQPMQIISNKPVVTVRLNDSRPMRFILDAGSPWTFLAKGVAEEIGFTGDPSAEPVGGFALAYTPKACVRVLGVALSDITVGEMELDHVSAVEGFKLDGLVGGELFNEYVVLLDYPGSRIRVYPKTYTYDGDGIVFPVTLQPHAYTDIDLLKPDGTYVRGNFVLDTGVRMAFLINGGWAHKHGLIAGEAAVRDLLVGVGVQGETRGDMFNLRAANLGGLVVRDITSVVAGDTVVVADDEAGNYAGILGGDLMRRFRVWFDYPHQRVIFEPTHELSKPFAYDRSGMFLLSEGENYRRVRVRSVAKSGPADAAGVQPGDVIVSIDGRMTKRLGLEETRRLFRENNTRYKLVLDRNGEMVRAEMVTKDLLETPAAN
jgi:hypothetical protein